MRKRITVLLILGLMAAVSCEMKRDAIGEPDVLIVIADSTDWLLLEHQLRKAFAPEIATPQNETWYNIQHVLPKNAREFFDYKNILLVSLLREGSPSLNLIKKMFSEQLVHAMQNGEQPVALKRNQWRKEQLLMLLTALGVKPFDEIIEFRGDELRGYFDEVFVNRQKEYLYERYEQKKLAKRFQEEHNWSIRVPRDFIIIHERPDSNFVWLGRHLPIRWLSIYWESVDGQVSVDSASAFRMRKFIGENHYGDIATNPDFVETEQVTLSGRKAVKIRGIWEHTNEAKGGVFIGYLLYDSDSGRLYYLDGQIFAPGMKKLVYLRQLDIVLNTFTPAPKE